MTTTPNYSQPKPEHKRGTKGFGCSKGIYTFLFIIIFIIGSFFVYNALLPALFPKIIRGDLENVRAFPSKDGKIKLWIETDGTLRFSSRSGNPGEYMVKTKGMFCRTFSYVYDPVAEDVEMAAKTSYDDIPPLSSVAYANNKIWVVTSYAPAPAEIYAYDVNTYQQVLNAKSFCEKTPELSAGIENVSLDSEVPVKLRISTKDGRELFYSLDDDKFFANSQEFEKYFREIDSSRISVFMLGKEDGSDKRRKLVYLTGKKYDIYFSYFRDEGLGEFKNLPANKFTVEEILPNRVFLEGNILYTDNEIAVILHQNVVGRVADRMLTCVDKSGKELWTIQQKDLLEAMKGDEKETLTEMSYLKTDCTVQRFGNTITLCCRRAGAMGFELSTGKKLWEYEY